MRIRISQLKRLDRETGTVTKVKSGRIAKSNNVSHTADSRSQIHERREIRRQGGTCQGRRKLLRS
jgi:hypothetical protein